MGMYTEVFIRAHIKRDAPTELIDWLDGLAHGNDDDWKPYSDHPYFATDDWDTIFCACHAVYQIARAIQFERSTEPYKDHELILHASAKHVPHETFLEWIGPWLAHHEGDFLGYSLYEDSRTTGWGGELDTDQPELIFMPKL